MQADLTVGASAHLHAPLQLGFVARRDSDRDRRAQQRRPARCLQVGQKIASLLRALEAEIGDALLAVGLRTHDLVRVLDPAPRDPQREAVRQVARVERKVDRKREAFWRGEHELGLCSRKAHALR